MSRYENKQLIVDAVAGTTSTAAVLKNLGLTISRANYRTVRKWCKVHGIELEIGNSARHPRPTSPLSLILVECSTYNRQSLKKRLLNEGYLQNKCSECGIGDEWNGKRIVNHLDHINGIHDDHRLENLRMLCPNCHSQTPTYSGRNNVRVAKSFCACGKQVSRKASMCFPCSRSPTKIDWPSMKDLLQMLEKSNYVQVGKKLGVSDNAIRKRIKNHGE